MHTWCFLGSLGGLPVDGVVSPLGAPVASKAASAQPGREGMRTPRAQDGTRGTREEFKAWFSHITWPDWFESRLSEVAT